MSDEDGRLMAYNLGFDHGIASSARFSEPRQSSDQAATENLKDDETASLSHQLSHMRESRDYYRDKHDFARDGWRATRNTSAELIARLNAEIEEWKQRTARAEAQVLGHLQAEHEQASEGWQDSLLKALELDRDKLISLAKLAEKYLRK